MTIGIRDIWEPKLRPCPWCKHPAILDQNPDGSWYACCSFKRCAVAPISSSYRHAHQVVEVWNCCERKDVMPAPVDGCPTNFPDHRMTDI